MKRNYVELTRPYYEDFLDNLKKYVAINSVYDDKTVNEENPFGVGVTNALTFIADLAKKDGFEVRKLANKIVEIICGEGEKNVTIMAHADVVPATGNWTSDPFIVRQEGNLLYGRGVSDDKGPGLASYYALKALRDNNLIKGYQVRLLVGGNEESGSLGMEYYFHELKSKQPTYGFSPDADWPVVFAEKGIFNFVIEDDFNLPGVISIEGGLVPNAVIDYCKIVTKYHIYATELQKDKDIEIKEEKIDGRFYIEVFGKAAHGSTPELGVNAVTHALKAIAKVESNQEFSNFVRKLDSNNGSGFGAVTKSSTMGENSSNLGIFSYKDGHARGVINFRFVNGTTYEQMKKIIEIASRPSKVSFSEPSNLLYYSPDSPLIKTLMASYQEETGDMRAKPISMGGGTYAKEADNVVAFGMQHEDFNTHMHEPDEVVRLSDLHQAMAIYANAIEKLGQLIVEGK